MEHQEAIDSKKVNRANRRGTLADTIYSPSGLLLAMGVMLAAGFFFPALFLLTIPATACLMIGFADRKYRAPLRMPKDSGMFDETETREINEEASFLGIRRARKKRIRVKAKGIIYLGYERGRLFGREIWQGLTDVLRHWTLFGTTGSGKTETFYGLMVNALTLGRGFSISDGKADNKLAFAVWSLCRRFGREEDFYVINLLTGSTDRFEQMINGKKVVAQTNTVNLFSVAPPTFITQLMEAMLPQVGGDSAQWQDTAKAMMSALINALCYKRARGELILSQRVIERNMSLVAMAELYLEAKRNGWQKEGYAALETYLENVPGFMLSRADQPDSWDSRAFEQHNYLSRQFLKTLALFNETYGHVFPQDSGDITMIDVLHNDRVLAFMIPSTELSRGEAATLGKLYITMVRMTISRDLGYELEGHMDDVMLVKSLDHQFPFPLIFDELGQYFSSGTDTLAAQMRSLGYWGIFSSQDHPSLARGAAGEEDSLMANTRTKYFESIEDEKTYQILQKTVGRDYFTQLQGVDKESGPFGATYKDSDRYGIAERDRVDMRELRSYTEGQGVISFQDALVRSAAFYIPDDEKFSSALPLRINRFVEVLPPGPATLASLYPGYMTDKEKAAAAEKPQTFPPVSLQGYTKDVNSLLEGMEVFYELNAGNCSSGEMAACLFELFAEWLDDEDTTELFLVEDDEFATLIG